ncbi:putative PA14 domain protein [Rosellinia necatrix]|uniref:Putative PA14 domain protein n=1 Tax=Rosellinia necatrix TaxID=77044 RepID=A0A1W2TPU8_ROSNE|nr:putative PA14 domain protein [Rosellinia necatrix]
MAPTKLNDTQLQQAKQLLHGLVGDEGTLLATLENTRCLSEAIDSVGTNAATSPESQARLTLIADLDKASQGDIELASQFWDQEHVLSISDAARNCSVLADEGDTSAVEEFQMRLFAEQPTAIIYSLIRSGHITVTPEDIKSAVLNIFDKAVSEGFNISKDPVDNLLEKAELGDNGDSQAIKTFLQNISRLQALVRLPTDLGALLESPFTSAHQIAHTPRNSFITAMSQYGLPAERAVFVHEHATVVDMRNEQVWTALLASRNDVQIAALTPTGSGNSNESHNQLLSRAISTTAGAVSSSKQVTSYSDIFASDMAFSACDDCNSVTSPAAYFVDLLRMLKNTPSDASKDSPPTLLDKLIIRRPDLLTLQLSCVNTNVLIPYIDLANEAMESFIKNVGALTPPTAVPINGYNMTDQDTSEISLSEPQHTDYSVYSNQLAAQTFPLAVFPYSQALDLQRLFFVNVNTSLSEVISAFGSESKLCQTAAGGSSPPAPTADQLKLAKDVLENAAAAEYLGVSPADYVIITGSSILSLDFLKAVVDSSMNQDSYEKKIGILATPKYWGYDSASDMLSEANNKGLPFVKAQLIRRADITVEQLLEILKARLLQGQLALENPDGSADFSGKIEDLRLRHPTDGNPKGPITEADCKLLQSTIRLWRKTGWTLQDLDCALVSFGTGDGTHGYTANSSTITAMAAIQRISAFTGVDIFRLMPLWGLMDTNGDKSLYARLFLKGRAGRKDPVFGPDDKGNYLQADASLNANRAPLLAAYRLTEESFSAIVAATKIIDDKLNLVNVTAIYRISVFCQILAIDPAYFESLKPMLDPNGDAFVKPQAALDIIKNFQHLIENAGLSLEQLLFFTGNDQVLIARNQDFSLTTQQIVTAVSDIIIKIQASKDGLPTIGDDTTTASPSDVATTSTKLFDGVTAQQVNAFIEMLPGTPLADTSVVYTNVLLPYFSNASEAHKTYFEQTEPTTGTDEEKAIAHENNLNSRRVYFLKAVIGPLGTRLANDIVLQALAPLLPDADVAVLRQLLSTVKGPDSKVILDVLTGLVNSNKGSLGKDSSDVFFRPLMADSYRFFVTDASMSSSPQVTLDGTALVFEKGTGGWNSNQVQLSNGQAYNMHRIDTGGLAGASFSTQRSPSQSFPLGTLLAHEITTSVQSDLRILIRSINLSTYFKLNLDEVQCFQSQSPGTTLAIDFGEIDYKAIQLLQSYKELSVKTTLPTDLLGFLKWTTNSSRVGTLANKLAVLLSVTEPQITDYLGQRFSGQTEQQMIALFQGTSELKQLLDSFSFAVGTGVPGLTLKLLFTIATPVVPPTATADFDNAAQLRLLLQSTPSSGNGGSLATQVNGGLRKNQRAALVAYLLQHPYVIARSITDADGLFEFLLIDVQMGPCLQTSRIKQAISTVQLYVRRCILGLEKGEEVASNTVNMDRWKWMEGYRLWEANRKVFLYPENWLDASLRDDKTEIFQALESAILQNDIDTDKIVELLKGYVYGVDNIADLDVQAYLWKKGTEDYTGTFHFFGRTRTAPYIYYYRTLEIAISPSGRAIKIYWQPWTKIDVEVPVYEVDAEGKLLQESGSYLIPALYGERVFLFFPQITLKTSPNTTPNDTSIKDLGDKKPNDVKPTKHWQIQIGWTEHRNGRWTPKQVSQATLDIAGAQENGFPGKGTPPGSAWAEAQKLPAISSLKFWIWSRPNAIVPPQNATKTIAAAASIASAVPAPSTSTLVIDVERWVDAGSTQSPRYVNYPLGRFEMRGSAGQVILADMNAAPSTDTFKTLWRATIPTVFTKMLYHKETDKDSDTPGLVIGRGKTQQVPQLGIVSDLVDNIAKKDIEWTISFNDAQAQKATGFIQDIVTTESTISYITYPPISTTTYASDVFQHTLDRDLISMATTYDGVDQVYAFLASVPQEEWFLAFGKRNTLVNELSTPYAIYNWELGAHAVMLLMERLQTTQQYDLALQVAHYVFDPTIDGSSLNRCWLFPPFRELADPAKPIKSIEDILKALQPSSGAEDEMNTNILQWRMNPFNPHVVARGRPQAYMRRMIMKYIEILIASGDVYFRQNTLEAVPFAIQRYVEASHVFGSAPMQLPRLTKPVYKSYADLDADFNDFSNADFDMELDFPFYSDPATRGSGSGSGNGGSAGVTGILKSTYFCVPANPKLMELRNLIDDRLFKIRNCQDINGVVRSLALFEPPLDPGMLVRATASGVDISKLLSNTVGPMPNYRFQFLLQKAFEMCAEVKSMGATLLSIKEKKDSEALSNLRARQDTVIQGLIIDLKKIAKREAESSITALLETRKAQVARLQYYLALTGTDDKSAPDENQEWEDIAQSIEKPTTDDLRMTSYEKLEMAKADAAASLNQKASAIDIAASIIKLIPDIEEEVEPLGVGVSLGSITKNISESMLIMASVLRFQGQYFADEGARASRTGALVRQLQERRFQANAAGRDIKETDKQIATSRIRVEIAERDIKLQEKQAAHAKDTEDWLRKKYSSEQLYVWMDGVVQNLYYQTYLLADDLAQKAQAAFRFENGNRSVDIIGPSSWDGGRNGLFAGENLFLSLKRLEAAYMERSAHDFEVVKNVSLHQVRPWALLGLRETGTAEFDLPEVLFDFDFPGHYGRRIKSVGMTVPCVVGPYTGVNATLTLLEHRYRVTADAKSASDYPQKASGDDARFQTDQVPISSIAVSGGQQDSGVFNLDFKDERYIPFEGAGAVSRWRLELPTAVRQFDYNTISDVVLHVKYTALQGGAGFRKAASDAAVAFQKTAADLSSTEGMFALLDLRNDFPSEWYRLVSADKSKPSTMPLSSLQDRLPFFTKGKTVKAETISVLVASGSGVDMGKDIELAAPTKITLTAGTSIGSYQVASAVKQAAAVTGWSLTLQPTAMNANISKIYIVFRYTM